MVNTGQAYYAAPQHVVPGLQVTGIVVAMVFCGHFLDGLDSYIDWLPVDISCLHLRVWQSRMPTSLCGTLCLYMLYRGAFCLLMMKRAGRQITDDDVRFINRDLSGNIQVVAPLFLIILH